MLFRVLTSVARKYWHDQVERPPIGRPSARDPYSRIRAISARLGAIELEEIPEVPH